MFLRAILWPLSLVYQYFTQKRIANAEPVTLDATVISIGNLTLGGTGKTPLALKLAKALKAKKSKVAIISRGYKGKLEGPIKVDAKKHTAADVGDEPLMLSQHCDVYVAKDRILGAKLAIENGATELILDDGHQNPAIKKDVSIVVVDGAVGFGNRLIFPAGPLRETPEAGLARADVVVWIGDKELASTELRGFDVPIYFANIVPKTRNFNKKYLAFCAIGRPEKFETTLQDLGVDLIDLIPFLDHHQYSEAEINELKNRASAEAATLITTEKDYVRLSESQKIGIEIVPIDIEFEKKSDVETILELRNRKNQNTLNKLQSPPI